MAAEYPFRFPSSPYEIAERRAQILSVLCRMDEGFRKTPVRSIRMNTLSVMLDAYDTLFFENKLKCAYRELKVTLSSRRTSTAGKFIYVRNCDTHLINAEIRMSSDFLMRLEKGPFRLNGMTASTPQEAFLIVFEHELCHALETMLYRETGHTKRFLSLANGLFGHTEMKHQLPTRKSEAAKMGIRVGACCEFEYQGRLYIGKIQRIGKRATVCVSSSGLYREQRTFYVPLNLLKMI